MGYRKRLQYGIGELRRTHPQWAELNRSGHTAKLSGVPKIPAKKRRATPTPVGPTHAQLLREDGSALTVRSPSEAMLASGMGGGKITRVPSGTWKHPNSALTDGCNYHIKVTTRMSYFFCIKCTLPHDQDTILGWGHYHPPINFIAS